MSKRSLREIASQPVSQASVDLSSMALRVLILLMDEFKHGIHVVIKVFKVAHRWLLDALYGSLSHLFLALANGFRLCRSLVISLK